MKYTKTKPRKYTKEELELLKKYKEGGLSNEEIAVKLDRTEVAISIKLKRLNKKNDTYNEKHREEKYKTNDMFMEKIKPKSVLDVFAGENSFYKKYDIDLITNDIKKYDTNYNLDYLKLLSLLYYEGKQYDLIDIDPFGSAYDGFDLAIKMAKIGIVITFGEMGHKRWKRLDFVENRYDINNLDDFNLSKLIDKVQKIGLRNKKRLKVIYQYEWQNIARVWFEIEPYKITKQWDKKEKEHLDIFDFIGGD